MNSKPNPVAECHKDYTTIGHCLLAIDKEDYLANYANQSSFTSYLVLAFIVLIAYISIKKF